MNIKLTAHDSVLQGESGGTAEKPLSVETSTALAEICEYVKGQRGIDFSAYRETTVLRRLQLRLESRGIPDHVSYLLFLRENPDEIDRLLEALTIKVSHFFRNPFVFEALGELVLPDLIETGRNSEIRIWCAGCSRGEEAYSIAILLRDLMEKEKISPHVLILATDIDRDALADAGRAVYGSNALTEVRKGHFDRYFTRENNGFCRLREDIRSMVTFAYHDVTSGRPPKEGIFSDYHLILCRNVLIYFNQDLQARVLRLFCDLLNTDGYLVLGEAESIGPGQAREFTEIARSTKIFRKERR